VQLKLLHYCFINLHQILHKKLNINKIIHIIHNLLNYRLIIVQKHWRFCVRIILKYMLILSVLRINRENNTFIVINVQIC